MNPSPSKRGSSVEAMPIQIAKEKPAPKPVRATSKQTVEIGRRMLGRVKDHCSTQGISFQEFTLQAISEKLQSLGEPGMDELEDSE